MTRNLMLTYVLMCLSVVMAAQKDSIHFVVNPRFDSVLSRASAERKLVFVDCYTDWCVWCKVMDKKMFTVDSVADFYNTNFMCIKINMEKGEGPALAARFNINGYYPTYLLVDNEGMIVSRLGEAPLDSVTRELDVARFISFGRNALRDTGIFAQYEREYASGIISQKRLLSYIELCHDVGGDCDALVDLFIAREHNPTDSLSWRVLRDFASVNTSAFRYFTNHRKVFVERYSEEIVDMLIVEKYQDAMRACISITPVNTVMYWDLRKDIDTLDAGFSDQAQKEFDLAFYYATENWTAYAALAETYIVYYGDNCDILSSMAWKFYKNVVDPAALVNAVAWAKRSTELCPNFGTFDTYARVLSKVGNKRAARKACKHAIALAKKYNRTEDAKMYGAIDYSDTEAFLHLMK